MSSDTQNAPPPYADVGPHNATTEFTPAKLILLKKAYEECDAETFMFDGQELFKPYAKYLIQFLERQFGEG